MEATEFAHLGSVYRTNADASVIEAKDGSTWNRTGSLTVVLEARRILAQPDCDCLRGSTFGDSSGRSGHAEGCTRQTDWEALVAAHTNALRRARAARGLRSHK